MTEPVAYYKDYNDGTTLYFRGSSLTETDKLDPLIKPLYTAEQLHPRVKMTQAEFDEWINLYDKKGFLTPLHFFELISNIENGYPLIYNIYLNGREKQLELLELWLRFKNYNPEETIEIVTDFKWFVRSREKYAADPVQGLPESGHLYLTDDIDNYGIANCEMTTFKDDATQFDTKEEAELWVNPLTEAVHLPVEE